uniref:Uncharacterized protein n=1 Tax=Stomoxys calcitrans TaxID=35570 RepID=A0A1I8PMP5_STOCA
MNCVAIPPSEDKRHAASNASSSSATAALAVTPLHIIHSEVTLTSPFIEHNTSASSAASASSSLAAAANKSQSLQRTTTTHLYCRSLEKDASALAAPQQRRASNSRGFASCLRGERDDAFLDYQQRAIQYDMAAAASQCRAAKYQGQCYQQEYAMDENHPVQVLQTSMCSTGSGSNFETTTGRSEYKSKTLPRIHFDNSITNDMSLNEGMFPIGNTVYSKGNGFFFTYVYLKFSNHS